MSRHSFYVPGPIQTLPMVLRAPMTSADYRPSSSSNEGHKANKMLKPASDK
jgi:hypothetical protein